MKRTSLISRIAILAVIYIAITIVFIGRLLYLQVSGQDYYTMSTPSRTYTRYVTIQAQRGEIFDRNGKPIVVNSYAYNLELDYASEPADDGEFNDMILDLTNLANSNGDGDKLTKTNEAMILTLRSGGIDFAFADGIFDTSKGRRLDKLITELGLEEGYTAEEAAEKLLDYYGITETEYDEESEEYNTYYLYPYDTAAMLFERRLDMTITDHSSVQPYVFAEDIGLDYLTSVEEKYTRGYNITVSASREYLYSGYASHILGRVGKIDKNYIDYYTEKGYSYDAIVGIDGVEAAFEDYLHGQDGLLEIVEDKYGNIISTSVKQEPVAGRDVWLTIDIDMQVVAENALAENIFKIREEATEPLTGEDASAGALTVLDVSTNEILAIASYPTYDLSTFSADFQTLSNDENQPYLNRALSGLYAPGSTFKVGVAVAALSEGIIDKDTIIDAQGVYMYYASSNYTPRCWLYVATGRVHGPITVVEAIQESCNYFFYDVGRQLTISKMNEYCLRYGLGLPTGVELSEATGILAGPDYRNDNGLSQWSPGDTLQAAIGQSDNLFTPLQISSYISTILNSGTRRSCHLLKYVKNFADGSIDYEKEPEILDSFVISDDILSTVKEGMKGVMDNGSAASVFSGYEISVGGKTGTAQVNADKSDNGIMTAFAPFDNPEIVVTCVIEQASGGTETGYSVRDVFDYYFKIGKWAPVVEDEDEETDETSDEITPSEDDDNINE